MKKMSKLLGSLLLALALVINVATPALAASAAKATKVASIPASWTDASEMVESDNVWAKSWAEYWIEQVGAKTDEEKAKALFLAATASMDYDYDTVYRNVNYNGKTMMVKEVPNGDLGYFIEQKSYLKCAQEASAYYSGEIAKPKGLCGDYARYMVGMCRAVGLPAYVEIGKMSDGTYHARVVVIFPSTMTAYYCDPCWASSAKDTMKYFMMSAATYNDNYTQGSISSERRPVKVPEIYNTNTGTVTQEVSKLIPVVVSKENRWSGSQCAPVTFLINGATKEVYMNTFYFNGYWWLSATDVCQILGHTPRNVNVEWMQDEGSVMFTRGDYRTRGAESNWTNGVKPEINKTAQAYKTFAYFDGELTDIEIILISGQSFVRLDQVAEKMDFTGSTSTHDSSGAYFYID